MPFFPFQYFFYKHVNDTLTLPLPIWTKHICPQDIHPGGSERVKGNIYFEVRES